MEKKIQDEDVFEGQYGVENGITRELRVCPMCLNSSMIAKYQEEETKGVKQGEKCLTSNCQFSSLGSKRNPIEHFLGHHGHPR